MKTVEEIKETIEDTKLACCKLLARLFYKLAKATNKDTGENIEISRYCEEQNLKADYTACYITNRIDEGLND